MASWEKFQALIHAAREARLTGEWIVNWNDGGVIRVKETKILTS